LRFKWKQGYKMSCISNEFWFDKKGEQERNKKEFCCSENNLVFNLMRELFERIIWENYSFSLFHFLDRKCLFFSFGVNWKSIKFYFCLLCTINFQQNYFYSFVISNHIKDYQLIFRRVNTKTRNDKNMNKIDLKVRNKIPIFIKI